MDSLQKLTELDAVARLHAHDATLFADDPEGRALAATSLGWTEPASGAASVLPQLERLAREVADESVSDIVLLGMGGSSLASLVIGDVLGGSGARLHVLDTTAPLSVAHVVGSLDPAKTLYVVASKSGSTIEPLSLYAIFRDEADNELGPLEAGRRFIAITDPDTPLQTLAATGGFRALISSPADVGGRFSALTVFGLLTTALLGADVRLLVDRATSAGVACTLPPAENPAARLAAFAADAFASGRDKLTIVASDTLSTFGLWVEQLVAESLGKDGTGIVPVVELSGGFPQGYGADRAIVVVRAADDQRLASWVGKFAESAPVFEVVLRDSYDLGGEFVRWEHAIALLGPLLGVNPFGQPNVAAAKAATAAVLAGEIAAPEPQYQLADGTTLTYTPALETPAAAPETLVSALGGLLHSRRSGDFLCVLAYLPADDTLLMPLRAAAIAVAEASSAAVTLEVGPRYLHSTGQLHKGGADNGVFVLITTRDHADVPVPGQAWGLCGLHRAQAEGDLTTLAAAGRRVLRVDLPDASSERIAEFAHALHAAVDGDGTSRG